MRANLTEKIREAVMAGEQEKAANAVSLCLENGVDARDILMEILAIWEEVAEFYKRPDASESQNNEFIKNVGRAYVPTYKILFLLDKEIPAAVDPKGSVVVGCMRGEAHTLIKDIIALLLKKSGYHVVYKLGTGKDTPESILESIKAANADALVLSVSRPETLPLIEETVTALRREGLREGVFVIIGGRAVDEEISRKLGCDLYEHRPLKAIEEVHRFINSKPKSNMLKNASCG
jgi:methanogenic corrinoid protein MtbC1